MALELKVNGTISLPDVVGIEYLTLQEKS